MQLGLDKHIRASPVVGRTDLRLDADWHEAGPIGLDGGGKPIFPPLPTIPGIYRMTFTGAPGQVRPRVYIGETDDLRRRAQGYRTPARRQRTNARINSKLKTHLRAGGAAQISTATTARVCLAAGGEAVTLDLWRKAPRMLAENAAVVTEQLVGDVDIENFGSDPDP